MSSPAFPYQREYPSTFSICSAIPRPALAVLRESESVHDSIFLIIITSFLRLLDGRDIKARLRHPTFGGFNRRRMVVEASAVNPRVRPGGFVMDWRSVPRTKIVDQ